MYRSLKETINGKLELTNNHKAVNDISVTHNEARRLGESNIHRKICKQVKQKETARNLLHEFV